MCCQSRDCTPVRWWRHVESGSEWPWGWRGENQAPGTRWSRCHSQCVASSATKCSENNTVLSREALDAKAKPFHWALRLYLLFVVGRVRQKSRHMEHDLIVLVSCVQGVSARGIRCGGRPIIQLIPSSSLVFTMYSMPNKAISPQAKQQDNSEWWISVYLDKMTVKTNAQSTIICKWSSVISTMDGSKCFNNSTMI